MRTTAAIGERLNDLIRYMYVAVIIVIPLSVKLYFPSIDLEVIFPAEPMIALLLVIIGASFLSKRTRRDIDRQALAHPITGFVVAYALASLVATIGSGLPLVSMKASLVRITYIAMFFMFPTCFRQQAGNKVNGPMLMRVYGYALLPVVLYALFNYFRNGGGRSAAGLAPFPFYIDHTIYSAALVFVLFVFGSLAMRAFTLTGSNWKAGSFAAITLLYLVALYLSFCRAAWLSVFVCAVFFLLRGVGILKWSSVLIGLITAFLVFLARGPLVERIMSNSIDSNADDAGFRESVLSVTNINSDVSNTERLNRWSCAYRMFLDKPLLGFGPGTFQFVYVAYQRPTEITYLSAPDTRDPAKIQRSWSFSDQLYVRKNPQLHYYSGGTAHSEYLLALSEGGILSFVTFCGLLFVALRRGLRSLDRPGDLRTKGFVLAALPGVMAYGVHGLFNNYLDDCKIAFLFWASLSILTTVDFEAHPRTKGAS